MSSAPSFGAPGGHIFDVVAQGLKKHSELRMRLWTLRSRTDRNTPSRLKTDLGKSGYNGFFCYKGYNGFLTDFNVFDRFITDFELQRMRAPTQSVWRPNEDTKMS